MDVGAGLYMYDVVVKSSRSLSHLLMSFARPFVKRFELCYRSIVLSILSVCLSVCDVRVLWPNGWTDQDETWH